MPPPSFAAPASLPGPSRSVRPHLHHHRTTPRAATQPPGPRLRRRVYRVRQPLVGALYPRWAPPLHASVALVEASGRRARLVDLLPADATEPATLVAMLAGRTVDGTIRKRDVTWPLKGGGVVIGECFGESGRNDEDVDRFVDAFPEGVKLVGRNCYDFEEALVEFLMLDNN